jgi:hypothetical protein
LLPPASLSWRVPFFYSPNTNSFNCFFKPYQQIFLERVHPEL